MRNCGLAAAIVLLGTGLAGCQKDAPQTPEEAYRAFYSALEKGALELALPYLAPEARQAFQRLGERLRPDGGPADDPLQWFLVYSTADRIGPLRAVEVLERAPDRVTLQTTAGPCGKNEECRVSRVAMVKVDGGWKVLPDLPPELGGQPIEKEKTR